jgi:regulator of replication initiation timing
MNSQEIQQKVVELKSIMTQYKQELGGLERELYRAISEYQKALEDEKLKEIRQSLN